MGPQIVLAGEASHGMQDIEGPGTSKPAVRLASGWLVRQLGFGLRLL
jgi:hypothetical protein